MTGDELRDQIARIDTTAHDLETMRDDPELAAYRHAVFRSGVPLLPTRAELVRAEEVLKRAAVCLTHYYEQGVHRTKEL